MNTELEEEKGRQGVTGHHVRTVLALSLVGSIIAVLIIGVVFM